jgi:hypothetical protein
MPSFFPRVQQLEEENTDLRTTVARLKSQTEKLDEVSRRSQQDLGSQSDGSQGWIAVTGALTYFPTEKTYQGMVAHTCDPSTQAAEKRGSSSATSSTLRPS